MAATACGLENGCSRSDSIFRRDARKMKNRIRASSSRTTASQGSETPKRLSLGSRSTMLDHMAEPRDEAAAEQSQEDHQADHSARSNLFLQDEGVQEREALKHPARRDQHDHELDEFAKVGSSQCQAKDHEWQRTGKQQIFADRCAEEEAEHKLGGRKRRDPVEIQNPRGPRVDTEVPIWVLPMMARITA